MSESEKSPNKPPRFDSLAQEVFLNLWRTYDKLRAFEDEMFAKHDLSAQQYNALRLLRAAHPAALATLELGGRLISRAPDMTRLLDRLQERELISRERRENNRRVVSVAITEKGLDLLTELDKDVQACHESQLGHMPSEAQRELIALLHRARQPHEEPGSLWS